MPHSCPRECLWSALANTAETPGFGVMRCAFLVRCTVSITHGARFCQVFVLSCVCVGLKGYAHSELVCVGLKGHAHSELKHSGSSEVARCRCF